MKFTIDLSKLDALVARMKAKKEPWNSDEDSGRSVGLPSELDTTGLLVSLRDVQVSKGGFLIAEVDGKLVQVLVYIKDTWDSEFTLRHEPENSKRFHIVDCDTLRKKRSDGSYDQRYVVTTRSDGKFHVISTDDPREHSELEAELKVCKNCLSQLNWKGYRGWFANKNVIWRDFNISDFLFEHTTFFPVLPTRRDMEVGPDDYPSNWSSISRLIKEKSDWTCKRCGVKLHQYNHLLHGHHINRKRKDCREDNLMALCVECHSKQPGHGHMEPRFRQDRPLLARIKSEQGIPPS